MINMPARPRPVVPQDRMERAEKDVRKAFLAARRSLNSRIGRLVSQAVHEAKRLQRRGFASRSAIQAAVRTVITQALKESGVGCPGEK